MKRLFILSICAVALCSLFGCSFNEIPLESNEYSANSTIGTLIETESSASSAEETELPPTDPPEPVVEIVDTVVYDNNDIFFEIYNYEYTSNGLSFLYTIKNNSDEAVVFSLSSYSINNFCFDEPRIIELGSMKKAVGMFTVPYENLELTGTENFLSFSSDDAHFSNSEYKKIYDCPIDIKSTLYGNYEYTVDTSGLLLYDENGITCIAKSLDEYKGNTALSVLVKNDTEYFLWPQEDMVSINGTMTSQYMSLESVAPHSYRYCYVELENVFDSSVLDSIGYNNIEEVAFRYVFYNAKNATKLLTTEEFVVSFS